MAWHTARVRPSGVRSPSLGSSQEKHQRGVHLCLRSLPVTGPTSSPPQEMATATDFCYAWRECGCPCSVPLPKTAVPAHQGATLSTQGLGSIPGMAQSGQGWRKRPRLIRMVSFTFAYHDLIITNGINISYFQFLTLQTLESKCSPRTLATSTRVNQGKGVQRPALPECQAGLRPGEDGAGNVRAGHSRLDQPRCLPGTQGVRSQP